MPLRMVSIATAAGIAIPSPLYTDGPNGMPIAAVYHPPSHHDPDSDDDQPSPTKRLKRSISGDDERDAKFLEQELDIEDKMDVDSIADK